MLHKHKIRITTGRLRVGCNGYWDTVEHMDVPVPNGEYTVQVLGEDRPLSLRVMFGGDICAASFVPGPSIVIDSAEIALGDAERDVVLVAGQGDGEYKSLWFFDPFGKVMSFNVYFWDHDVDGPPWLGGDRRGRHLELEG